MSNDANHEEISKEASVGLLPNRCIRKEGFEKVKDLQWNSLLLKALWEVNQDVATVEERYVKGPSWMKDHNDPKN